MHHLDIQNQLRSALDEANSCSVRLEVLLNDAKLPGFRTPELRYQIAQTNQEWAQKMAAYIEAYKKYHMI